MANEITKQTTPIELTAIVSKHLAAHGISATLTGGTVVSIYTDNKYESGDLDYISPADHSEILKVMEKIGFKPVPVGSKNLSHSECPITVEFPARTLVIGGQPAKVDHLESVGGVQVKMLSPTQSVMDRLAGYIAWNDRQNLDQAEWICEKQPVDLEKVKRWAKKEAATAEQLKKIIECCERGAAKFNE